MATNTFKLRLPMDFDLRKSLTMNPAWGMHHLMDRIEEHKRVEDDQLQGKGARAQGTLAKPICTIGTKKGIL